LGAISGQVVADLLSEMTSCFDLRVELADAELESI
jgi:hypothetical protein